MRRLLLLLALLVSCGSKETGLDYATQLCTAALERQGYEGVEVLEAAPLERGAQVDLRAVLDGEPRNRLECWLRGEDKLKIIELADNLRLLPLE